MMSQPRVQILADGAEGLIGIGVVVFWKQAWPIYLSLVGFVVLLIASVVIAPEQAIHAFNPITLTVSAILFCLIQINLRSSMNTLSIS